MICQNCGQEIEEGKLYCEACGAEQQIVPDFDPEVENSILENMSKVLESLEDSNTSKDELKGTSSIKGTTNRNLTFGIIALVIVIFLIGWNTLNSVSSLEKRVTSNIEMGQYEKALDILFRLEKREKHQPKWYLLTAEVYQELENTQEAKDHLYKAIARIPDSDKLYQRLIGILDKEQDYASINDLLLACKEDSIVNLFQSYMAMQPIFDTPEGNYDTKISLKLSSNTSGNIYYTMDGSVPTEDSYLYTAPLDLGKGTHIIRAVFINEYGIKSEIAEANYVMDIPIPATPIITPENGEFNTPTLLTVEGDGENPIYYTLDGSAPSLESILYTGPISIPLGESYYKFAAISQEGISSEVVSREYMLNLKTGLNEEEARVNLIQRLIEVGHLLDKNGALANRYGVFRYQYSYPVAIGENNYYIFMEYYAENLLREKTGAYYAVDVLTGEKYKAYPKEDGTCEIQALE